jgi:hypothetical protein
MHIGMRPPDEYLIQSTFAQPCRSGARRVLHHLDDNKTETFKLANDYADDLKSLPQGLGALFLSYRVAA